MASGSPFMLNSVSSQGYETLYSYHHFNGRGGIDGTHPADEDFHTGGMTRSSFVPASVYRQHDYSISQEVISAVEKSMQKNSDNLLRFLEGISSRLSQIELYCYNVDKSIGEMRSDLVHGHGVVNSKLNAVEENIGEVQRSVKILRDKQEIAETHKALAKLHLAQKESANNSDHSQHTEKRSSTPAMVPPKVSDFLEKSALSLPHELPQSQQSHPPRTADPSRSGLPPASAQSQNVQQQQHYYVTPSQIPPQPQPQAQPQPQPPQDHGQYATPNSQYGQSHTQDMSELPLQVVQPSTSQVLPPSQVLQFPQYQQQWPHESQQQLQPQSLQHPPKLNHIRTQSGLAYLSYQPSQPTSPPETIPCSMAVQRPFSAAQSGISRANATIYGYVGRPVQQQPPTQQLSANYGTQANNECTNMGFQTAYTPSSGYLMCGVEEGRPHSPPQQPYFYQGGYSPTLRNPITRNPSQSQSVRNLPYSDLIQNLVKMGFRGDHASNLIQMMEDSGQPVNFHSVLERISAQSSVSCHEGDPAKFSFQGPPFSQSFSVPIH